MFTRPHFKRLPAAHPAAALAIALTTLLGALPSLAVADVLAAWDVHGLTGGTNNFGNSPLAATTSASNLTVGGLTRGSGVGTTGTAAGQAWGGNSWTSTTAAAAITANKFATFTLTASTGYQLSLSSISHFDYRRSTSGPANGVLQVQVGSGAFTDVSALSYSSTSSSGASLTAIDLSSTPALQNVPAGTTVTFRIVNYGGSASGGTWYLYDHAGSTAADLEVSGTVTPSGPSVDGACGSASGLTFATVPSSNLCSAGTPSAVTGGSAWNWTCLGSNGGRTASCTATSSAATGC